MDARGRRTRAQFPKAGLKRIMLDVIGPSGASRSITRSVQVHPPPRLTSATPQPLARVLERVLPARCEGITGSRCRLTATIPAATARQLGLRAAGSSRPYAFGRSVEGPVARTLRIQSSSRVRRALERPRRVEVVLRAVVTRADGRTTELSRRVTLER